MMIWWGWYIFSVYIYGKCSDIALVLLLGFVSSMYWFTLTGNRN